MGLRLVNSEYIDTLELQLAQQRGDYQKWLGDKDTEIRRLRAELAGRSVRIEPNLQDSVKAFQAKMTEVTDAPNVYGGRMDWQGELNELLKQEEEKDDGIQKL